MVLVVGSTEMVGSEICQRLTRQGEKIRALVRPTSWSEKVASLRGCGVEVFEADLKDAGSLTHAGAWMRSSRLRLLLSPGRRETRLKQSTVLDNCTGTAEVLRLRATSVALRSE
jgi:nucleoside-diphosphate-sugar epimerase